MYRYMYIWRFNGADLLWFGFHRILLSLEALSMMLTMSGAHISWNVDALESLPELSVDVSWTTLIPLSRFGQVWQLGRLN